MAQRKSWAHKWQNPTLEVFTVDCSLECQQSKLSVINYYHGLIIIMVLIKKILRLPVKPWPLHLMFLELTTCWTQNDCFGNEGGKIKEANRFVVSVLNHRYSPPLLTVTRRGAASLGLTGRVFAPRPMIPKKSMKIVFHYRLDGCVAS